MSVRTESKVCCHCGKSLGLGDHYFGLQDMDDEEGIIFFHKECIIPMCKERNYTKAEIKMFLKMVGANDLKVE